MLIWGSAGWKAHLTRAFALSYHPPCPAPFCTASLRKKKFSLFLLIFLPRSLTFTSSCLFLSFTCLFLIFALAVSTSVMLYWIINQSYLMLCTGHDTKFLSYSDLCSLFQIKQTLLAPWRKHNWYESSNEIVQLKEHLKKLSHVGLWSRMGQSRQQILSDWTNTPALPLLASLSLSRPASLAWLFLIMYLFV